jgi:anion-transporting  ArsA/GET3 family ATPase
MGTHVQLNVPPAAETARLLTRNRRWGVYYRSLVGDSTGRLEFRQIDPDLLRADQVDPADADAVVNHVEHRLQAAGYDTVRRPPEGEPIAAAWDISRRATA